MRISKALVAAATLGVLLSGCRGNTPEQQSSREAEPAVPAQQSAPPPPPIVVGSSRVVGFVFDDKNRNETYDGGEMRLPSTTVLVTNPSATKRIQELTTDAMGVFRVDGLGDGDYRISVQIPEGYVRTNDDSFSLKISAGQPAPEVHFGVTRR
jgi:hypothetical protein